MSDAAKDSGLLKHSLLLIAFTQVSNVSNLLFHMVMGRNLPTSEYGILMAMLNVMLIIGTPLDAVRTSMAHFAGRASVEGRKSDVRNLLKLWGLRMGLLGVGLSILGLFSASHVAAFFHLSSIWPVWITCLTIPAMLMIPLMSGALQGIQAFVWMSLSGQGWFVVRLLLGYSLVVFFAPVAVAGLTAQAAAMIFGVGVGLCGILLCIPQSQAESKGFKGVGVYIARSIPLLGAFAILMNADNILLKHYFKPDDAGLFARAFTISRLVIFLPMPVAYALFPKVISAGGITSKTRWMLLSALGLSAAMIVLAAGFCMAIPQLPLGLIYKDWTPSADSVRLLRMACVAMMPLGLSYIVMSFEMAQHRFRSTAGVAVAAAVYLVSTALWHQTPFQMAWALGVSGTIALLVLLASTFSAKEDNLKPEEEPENTHLKNATRSGT